ncbi:endonuclease V [Acanthamoeba polyphaga mimivirus]|uniref:Endonuclease V n=2 Tax=Megamimivirinae TaxID=3044648 RepID=A0A2L2DLB7_MIMIV|nr:endonuclease V [Megavirus chiliensis]AEQ32961.1 endonuclease V [Megavirus chiliensis]AVG45867.1 endonuclease V [Acanthamoeba polyphaga mimivirus]AVG46969.1 endonuclease V [Acanthamoeba polyphaga mimivirus]
MLEISNEQKNIWIDYQTLIAKSIIQVDMFNDITLVGGLDISFDRVIENKACAYITIYDIQTKTIVYEDHEICHLDIPYVSGFLGLREVPVYKILLNRVKINKPNLYPHIVMVDGYGILHHRGAGSASQLGYELNLPTIGVGKTFLCLDDLYNLKKELKLKFKTECTSKGDYLLLKGDSGKIYGAAIKTTNDSTNPLYVSIGHKISLQTAMNVVLKCCNYRIPEPIRNSDIKSKLYF